VKARAVTPDGCESGPALERSLFDIQRRIESESCDGFIGTCNDLPHVFETERFNIVGHLVIVRISDERRIIDHQCRDIEFPVISLI